MSECLVVKLGNGNIPVEVLPGQGFLAEFSYTVSCLIVLRPEDSGPLEFGPESNGYYC